jgi:hypothetical protein
MTIEMTHFRYFDHQSRISGAGVNASLILFRFPSFVGVVDDSHNFEVEAFAFNVVAGEGSDCVDVDAIGRDVSRGFKAREFRKVSTAICDLGLGIALLSLISCLSENTSPSLDALLPSYGGNCSPDHSPYAYP